MAWRDGARPPDAAARHPIELPERPVHLRDRAAAAWSEPVLIDTYPVAEPDRNPLFLENRVYQGSSGRVYPNPVTDRVADESVPTTWQAVHLENEYLRVMVLPEIGGRIHVVQDRKTGYDIFYRQNVIKPALVGLLGPWISGGVEFNWPQHHRPSTYMPTDWQIESLPDGGAVVWCSEHEPTERMKGMHGVVLRPDSSVLELQVRLTNRTPLVQSFLWWANVCVRVHDDYEAYFPPDVSYVADHAKRAMSTFPIAKGHYYGVDYGSRPAAEADLRWYRNIPVPTSYMAMGSAKDFFGGYDHAVGEGYVHWADHTISPGKKLWTWGDHEFGHAWDRELTDEDGPYAELMAGVFTDNQPDFGFLLPGEVRTFTQSWYPLVGTGPAQEANPEAAISLERTEGGARLAMATTRARQGATIRVAQGARPIFERTIDLAPDQPFLATIDLAEGTRLTELKASLSHAGRELLAYRPAVVRRGEPPAAATEPPPPAAVASLEELYLTGMHLQQYRHSTRRAEDYYREALRRDPGDSRCNTAMGEWHLRRGEYADAIRHLRAALERLSIRNTNPRDGEARYLLGVALRLAGDPADADDAFGKAGWSGAFVAASDTARAEIAAARGDAAMALSLVERALAVHPGEPGALGLRAALLRRGGDLAAARETVAGMLVTDPLDVRAIHELALLDGDAERALPGGTQTALDIAHDEARGGLLDEALDALERAAQAGADRGTEPLLQYTRAWLESLRGKMTASRRHLRRARAAPPDYAFPARLEEITILAWAMEQEPQDPRAPYYLGNLLYDKRRYHEAIAAWRRAARLDPSFPTAHRNLGIAEFNVLGRPEQSLAAYRRAYRANPADARVLYELDQLRKRMGHACASRLRALGSVLPLVAQRDDLTVEYVALLNGARRYREAIEHMSSRRFHPWEGGEGLVSQQWVVANRELAREALRGGDPAAAASWTRAAMNYPRSLGEARHLLVPQNELQFLLGTCLRAYGNEPEALGCFELAAAPQGDPAAAPVDGLYWQALALRALGREDAADERVAVLAAAAEEQARAEVSVPYFATSLPTLLLFDDDLTERSRGEASYLAGLALLGQGRRRAARTRFEALLAVRPDHLEAALRVSEMEARRG